MKFLIPLTLLAFISINGTNKDLLNGKDLFSEASEIKATWLGYIKANKSKTTIRNVPMFIINKANKTYAKIICVPLKPLEWDAKFVGKTSQQKISIAKTLVDGIHSHSLGANVFKIFALVQEIDEKSGNRKSSKNLIPRFPSRVVVYTNAGKSWNHLTEKTINNAADYQNLQYEISKTPL